MANTRNPQGKAIAKDAGHNWPSLRITLYIAGEEVLGPPSHKQDMSQSHSRLHFGHGYDIRIPLRQAKIF